MPERRLWEFYSPITCRILGLSLSEKEMEKIFKRFDFNGNPSLLALSRMHGQLVQVCTDPNPCSKYVDKILQKRFGLYRKKVNGLSPKDICQIIERGERVDGVPLSALIWFAVRRKDEEIDEIEGRVFAAIHLREHQALRFYDVLSETMPSGSPEAVIEELKETRSLKKKLEVRTERLERKIENLKAEIENTRKEKSRIEMAREEKTRELKILREENRKLKEDLEGLKRGTVSEQIKAQKKEIESLKQELKTAELLTRKLARQNQIYEAAGKKLRSPFCRGKDIEPEEGERNKQTLSFSLEARKVAFVGGLDSLLPHYRQVVEDLGGVFYSHCGKVSNGRGDLDMLVGKVDAVFCPVNINSHHACLRVKRACKLRNKPCCFLRSSGLNAFKEALVEFARRGCLERMDEIRSLN